jgi:hypothetical protein
MIGRVHAMVVSRQMMEGHVTVVHLDRRIGEDEVVRLRGPGQLSACSQPLGPANHFAEGSSDLGRSCPMSERSCARALAVMSCN